VASGSPSGKFYSLAQTFSYATAPDVKEKLEEIDSIFGITNKRSFSVAERMFKPDRCHLPGKRFEALMFINCNKDFKH